MYVSLLYISISTSLSIGSRRARPTPGRGRAIYSSIVIQLYISISRVVRDTLVSHRTSYVPGPGARRDTRGSRAVDKKRWEEVDQTSSR